MGQLQWLIWQMKEEMDWKMVNSNVELKKEQLKRTRTCRKKSTNDHKWREKKSCNTWFDNWNQWIVKMANN